MTHVDACAFVASRGAARSRRRVAPRAARRSKPRPASPKRSPSSERSSRPRAASRRRRSRPRRPTDSAKSDNDTVDGYRVIQRAHQGRRHHRDQRQAAEGLGDHAPRRPSPIRRPASSRSRKPRQGLPKQGTLAAQIKTSLGSFYCDLFADKAPITVANFVGLARGKRKFWDADKLAWVARPYYDGTTFHRVIPGFMIQGGDHTGTGRGEHRLHDPGRGAPDVAPRSARPAVHGEPRAEHERGAVLHHRRRGAAPRGQLHDLRPVRAGDAGAAHRARAAVGPPDNRPLTPVVIEHVEIGASSGGAAKWMPESAKLPPMPGVAARRAARSKRRKRPTGVLKQVRIAGQCYDRSRAASCACRLSLDESRSTSSCGFSEPSSRALKRSRTWASTSRPVNTLRTSRCDVGLAQEAPDLLRDRLDDAAADVAELLDERATRCPWGRTTRRPSRAVRVRPRSPCGSAPAGCDRAGAHVARAALAHLVSRASRLRPRGVERIVADASIGRRRRREDGREVMVRPLWKSRPLVSKRGLV